MNILTTVLLFLLTLAIILGFNVICRKYVFNKLRVSKWIPLSIGVILFVIQYVLQYIMNIVNIYVTGGLTILAVLFFLWFMEIMQTGGPKRKEKQIVIKPKAKPNRVKKNK
ncbi:MULTISPECIES: hypothetical protein [unclassified Clostridium]|uniref:hypothetical protein n=1 Tax=unclassified Clostridium TaxID=2614128 RepID=UPI000297CD92|nr:MULTISPECIES: hypothetical protein [unclassified Clostridium]EKQ53839.1 MAG: hypothetical protein A370_03585 [Clostridium sp. Maddingley MBC34-26]